MSRWKYNIEKGTELRTVLEEENKTINTITAAYNKILECLNCLKDMLNKTDSEIWEEEIDTLIEELENARNDITENESDYDEEADIFDSYLNEFYCLCDSMDVFVNL